MKSLTGRGSILDRLIRALGGTGRVRKEVERSGLFASRTQEAAFRKLEAAAPLVTEAHHAPVPVVTHSSTPLALNSPSIVRREAILGRNTRVAGYVFSLVYQANARVQASSVSVQRLYDQVLLRNLQAIGIRRLLEHRLAFIDVSASSLETPVVEEMPAQGTVYLFGANDGLARPHNATLARLRAKGYRIGLRSRGATPMPGLDQLDFLLIDIAAGDLPSIRDQMQAAVARAPKIRFVAANVQTQEEYRACAGLPFSYYQGPFITSREQLDGPVVDAGRARILEVLNALRGDAEVGELAALIKQNLALSYKLLRYINSPGMGLSRTIVAPEPALLVLGRQKLYRWLAILLFTSGKTPGLDWAVMENALVRARLAELLAECTGDLTPGERDELFVAGMFSLLDVVLSAPLDAVLQKVKLPAPVSDALLEREGKYAPYLALAIACEESDDLNIATLAQGIGLDMWRVNSFHLDAMLWAQQIGD
ncbi:Predicted signal transduction protein containing EAL and modified HD-GYP domains [Thiobacillus denitrificans ATCC 25259]|uniref:Predicted signal transduction protein containing EAL and modified HD-GYP domains n=1 Tax=Thiobacillus denitrificans (strain ATCC 25259 / T1) TaxID=292415 RepID=Q3SGY1_THIDA|nr:HDOD domain-containing protein [Thiobacillus denitrificans]AAZ98112.1 Predicted signal transduction protein containing EAL and modified HD-GYP domains [Thiobacillus denitrificans ATCC 25259]